MKGIAEYMRRTNAEAEAKGEHVVPLGLDLAHAVGHQSRPLLPATSLPTSLLPPSLLHPAHSLPLLAPGPYLP